MLDLTLSLLKLTAWETADRDHVKVETESRFCPGEMWHLNQLGRSLVDLPTA